MYNWKGKHKATNAIYLQDSNGTEGRPFKARFLQAGLVKYDFGVCLLKKETIDSFINTFVGTPVIIDHKDDITEDDKVGVINNIWFSPEDGWFWCDGIITDNNAVELIEKGYNVSCQYRITDYSENHEGKLHNGNSYDKEILNGVFEHLAIVENPRYEDAFIAVNAYIKEVKEVLTIENFKNALYDALAKGIVNRLGEYLAKNEDRWITLHPNGKGKGVKLKIEEGETYKEAITKLNERNKKQGYSYEKKREAWQILSTATGKSVKWLQMQYKKSSEKIQDLFEGTDRLNGFKAKYYTELLQTNYENDYGNENIDIGEKVAQKALEDLINDNFYDEVYLRQQEAGEYYKQQAEERTKELLSKVKTQFVKDLLEKNKNLSEDIFNAIVSEIATSQDTERSNLLLDDLETLEKIYLKDENIDDDDIPLF